MSHVTALKAIVGFPFVEIYYSTKFCDMSIIKRWFTNTVLMILPSVSRLPVANSLIMQKKKKVKMLAVRFYSYLKLLVDRDLLNHPLGRVVQSIGTTFITLTFLLYSFMFIFKRQLRSCIRWSVNFNRNIILSDSKNSVFISLFSLVCKKHQWLDIRARVVFDFTKTSVQKVTFLFYLGFLSQPFMNHRTTGEGGRHFFNSSLPLPPAL